MAYLHEILITLAVILPIITAQQLYGRSREYLPPKPVKQYLPSKQPVKDYLPPKLPVYGVKKPIVPKPVLPVEPVREEFPVGNPFDPRGELPIDRPLRGVPGDRGPRWNPRNIFRRNEPFGRDRPLSENRDRRRGIFNRGQRPRGILDPGSFDPQSLDGLDPLSDGIDRFPRGRPPFWRVNQDTVRDRPSPLDRRDRQRGILSGLSNRFRERPRNTDPDFRRIFRETIRDRNPERRRLGRNRGLFDFQQERRGDFI